MGLVRKQGIISIILTYLGILIGYVNVAFLFPKFFPPEYFGLRSALTEASLVLSQVGLLGFPAVTTKFFPFYQNSDNRKSFLTFITIVPIFGFLLVAVVLLLFKNFIFSIYEDSPLIRRYYFLLFPLILFYIYNSLFEFYSFSLKRITFPNLSKEVGIRVLTLIIILLFAFEFLSMTQFWVAYVLVYLINSISLIWYLTYLKSFSFSFNFSWLNKQVLKKVFSFAIFNVFLGTASFLVLRIDVLMVSSMVGLEATAIYTLAIFIATIVEVPKRSLVQIYLPLVAEAWKSKNIPKIAVLYKRSSLLQLILGGFIFLLIWQNIDDLFYFIPKSETYSAGKYVVFFISLTKLLDMATGINNEIIVYSKYYKFNFIALFILAFFTIISNYIFISEFGITGAAAATAVSYFVFNLVKYIFILIKIKVQPFSLKTAQVIIIAGVIFFAVGFIPTTYHPIISILIKSTVITILYAAGILGLNVSEDINNWTKKIFTKILKSISSR